MYDTYAYSSFEHIYRNIGTRSSGLDYDLTLLLLVGEVFLNVFNNFVITYIQSYGTLLKTLDKLIA